jgi:hypothetical protein
MEFTSRVVITVVILTVICVSLPSVKSLSKYETKEENRVGGFSENVVEIVNYLLTNTSSEPNLNSYGDINGGLYPTLQSALIENLDSRGENKIKETEVLFPANFAADSGEQDLRRNESLRDSARDTGDEEGYITYYYIFLDY